MGYHLREIKKGKIGEFSKIEEEFDELMEAREQNNQVMLLVELTDLLGAIDEYSKNYFNVTVEDLLVMTKATQRAFRDGSRK